jgi:hypothetical protein
MLSMVMVNASPRVSVRRLIAVSMSPMSAVRVAMRWSAWVTLRQSASVAVVGAFGAFQPGQVGVGFGFVHQQGVAGGQGLDLVVGQGGVTDVLDFADIEAAAHDLGDEPGLAFDGLPHIAVERFFGYISQDADFRVMVAVAQDAALALGDVGRPPGAVQVVQRDGAELDVGADAHLLGATDQDSDGPGAAGGEQLALVPVGFRVVHEPDGLARHALVGELVAESVVDVPVVAWGCRCRRTRAGGCRGWERPARPGPGRCRRGGLATARQSGRQRPRSSLGRS